MKEAEEAEEAWTLCSPSNMKMMPRHRLSM